MKKGSLELNLLNLSLINYVHHFPPPCSDTRTLEGKLILVRTNERNNEQGSGSKEIRQKHFKCLNKENDCC